MANVVEVNTSIEFEAWRSPNFAIIAQDQSIAQQRDGAAIKVEKLSADALAALAKAWLDDLYAKAGEPCPFTLNPLK